MNITTHKPSGKKDPERRKKYDHDKPLMSQKLETSVYCLSKDCRTGNTSCQSIKNGLEALIDPPMPRTCDGA